ncbi:MAG: TldD/PmbA family protein, partial [Ilumatobacteraceae bacterium]
MSRESDLAGLAVERAGAALRGADVHATADRHRVGLTRFANSVIHQNVADDIVTVVLRIHHDGRTSEASTTVTSSDDVQILVERVVGSIGAAPLDAGWPGLAPPAELPAASPLDGATASATSRDRAAVVRDFVDGAGGMETAGYCRTTHWTGALANS